MNGDTKESTKEVRKVEAICSCAEAKTEKSPAVRGRGACCGAEQTGLDNIQSAERSQDTV